MRSFTLGGIVAATTLFASTVLADVDPIVIKGSKFFYKTNGTQFYIRGVAYQQDYAGNGSTTTTSTTQKYTDPLTDSASCMRDIPYLQQLRTNTIRVYAIDPTKDHDACMRALADAGIYVLADLSQPGQSINRDSPSWNDDLYARYTSVVDKLAPYSNTLGFFAGNEVSNNINNTAASAFVKAAVRDTKAYIKSKNYRPIGVGYAADDDANVRAAMASYMNCGDAASSIDFWGYNIYEWCGESSFTTSGYDQRTKEFSDYSVPVFFAEYGCNDQPRLFGDTPVLFGPDMNGVWSGGIVYMYFQEANNFGLVSVDGSTVSKLPSFSSYSSQIAKVSPTGVQSGSYSPTNKPRDCPSTGSTWAAPATPLPPTPNKQLCTCMYDSLSCVVKGSVSADNFGQLFGTVCGLGDGKSCAGINTNVTTGGSYGAYGMCNATEQLAYAFDTYYKKQGSKASACDFGGAASTKAATSASGACSGLVAQAGTAGTGTVTSSPTGTAAAGGSGGSSGPTGAASPLAAPSIGSTGLWQLTTFITVAFLSGTGMILL